MSAPMPLKEVFELAKGKSGGVPANKVGLVVRSQLLCPTEKQLQAAIAAAGVSGEASLDQINKICSSLAATRPQNIAGTLSGAIRSFDFDGVGTVGVTDLSNYLTRLGDKIDTQSLNQVFRDADVDGFGQLDYVDFAKQLCPK